MIHTTIEYHLDGTSIVIGDPSWSKSCCPRHPNTFREGVLGIFLGSSHSFSAGVWMSRVSDFHPVTSDSDEGKQRTETHLDCTPKRGKVMWLNIENLLTPKIMERSKFSIIYLSKNIVGGYFLDGILHTSPNYWSKIHSKKNHIYLPEKGTKRETPRLQNVNRKSLRSFWGLVSEKLESPVPINCFLQLLPQN